MKVKIRRDHRKLISFGSFIKMFTNVKLCGQQSRGRSKKNGLTACQDKKPQAYKKRYKRSQANCRDESRINSANTIWTATVYSTKLFIKDARS